MRETITKVTCDRCKEPVPEVADGAAAPSKREGLGGSVFIDAKALGLGEIILDDLDERCRTEVTALLRDVITRRAASPAISEAAPEPQAPPRPQTEDVLPAAPTGGHTMLNEEGKTAMPEEKDDDERETERERDREEEEEEEDDEK